MDTLVSTRQTPAWCNWGVAIAIAVVFSCSSLFAGDRAYEVSGEISHRLSVRGKVIVEMFRDFTVRVDDCRWKIITTDIGTNKFHRAIAAWETGCDGRDTYAMTRFDKEMRPTRVLGPGNSVETSIITNIALPDIAEVNPGMIPSRGPSFHAFVWFSLASACYLDEAPKGRLGQIWEYEDPERQYKEATMEAQVERLDSTLGLPSQVAFFSDGKYYAVKDGRSVVVDGKPPYNKGWTNAIYKVSQATNFQGLRIPLSFTLLRYVPKNGGRTAEELVVFEETIGRVTRVSRSQDSSPFLPANELGRPVLDNRFRGNTEVPVVAKSKTGEWLDRSGVEAMPSFKVQVASGQQYQRQKERAANRLPAYRWVTYAAFIVLAAAPFLVVLSKRKHKTQVE